MNTPKPPTDDRYRFLRGGTWYNSSASIVRAACRDGYTPSLRSYFIGFRTVQTGCRQFLVNP